MSMSNIIFSDDVLEVVRSFMSVNSRDESACDLILAMGVELLDISPDELLEMIEQ